MLLKRWEKLNMLITGIVCGFTPGLILYASCLYRVISSSRLFLNALIILNMILSGALCSIFGTHIFIMYTALAGGYMMLRVILILVIKTLGNKCVSRWISERISNFCTSPRQWLLWGNTSPFYCHFTSDIGTTTHPHLLNSRVRGRYIRNSDSTEMAQK